MNGPLYRQTEQTMAMLEARKRYVHFVREAEEVRHTDANLSEALKDHGMQNLAHAVWLYLVGRSGFYCKVLDDLESRLN